MISSVRLGCGSTVRGVHSIGCTSSVAAQIAMTTGGAAKATGLRDRASASVLAVPGMCSKK